jgi:hypothetical protein
MQSVTIEPRTLLPMTIEQPKTYTWPTDAVYLAKLDCSLDELASRLNLEIDCLDDPNGPARAIGFRTAEERVYEVLEWRHFQEERARVTIHADASVLGAIGPPTLIADLISEAGFSRSDFSDIADAAAQVAAAEWVTSIREHRTRLPEKHEAEISFDLIMEDEMAFAEGTYRMRGGDWHVFIFSRHDGDGIRSAFNEWSSGVTGRVVRVPQNAKLNRQTIKQILGDILYVNEWLEVRGPDSMNLR